MEVTVMAHTDREALLALASKRAAQPCGVETTLSVIEGRWKLLILFQLLDGRKRFSELKRTLTGVTQRMLTLHLRELERDGLVHREVYREVPPKVEYSLTAMGMLAGTAAPLHERVGSWSPHVAGGGLTARRSRPDGFGAGCGGGGMILVASGIRLRRYSGRLCFGSAYSGTVSPEPPISDGKSFSFGNPSRIRSTVSA
jgi:DNA-binding HxlR family transcriptional regulator